MNESLLGRFCASLKSLVKVMLKSRQCSLRKLQPSPGRPLLVLGNGPSLLQTLQADAQLIDQCDLLAVNFAANTPQFKQLRPQYYVLADPHFFNGTSSDPNVAKLLDNFVNAVDWPMTLFVPIEQKNFRVDNPNVIVKTFNMLGAEGFACIENILYDLHWAMPRPRNVLIPSIMIGIWLGYSKIYIAGADHSWTRTLDVDDNNTVRSVQPHFYADNADESARVSHVYKDIRLHEILLSFHIAFRAYHRIARYAKARDVDIVNITPGSFIDAFPRLQS